MTLPGLTCPPKIVSTVHDAAIAIGPIPETCTVAFAITNAGITVGLELSAWDADALAAMIHTAVTETLFDLPAVS